MRWLLSVAVGVFVVLSALATATANAQPAQPDPTITSTTDELTDMVMDVIEHGGIGSDPLLPTITPGPPPPQ